MVSMICGQMVGQNPISIADMDSHASIKHRIIHLNGINDFVKRGQKPPKRGGLEGDFVLVNKS